MLFEHERQEATFRNKHFATCICSCWGAVRLTALVSDRRICGKVALGLDSKSLTSRSESGWRTYIITTKRITSSDELKQRTGMAGFLRQDVSLPYPHNTNFESAAFSLTMPAAALVVQVHALFVPIFSSILFSSFCRLSHTLTLLSGKSEPKQNHRLYGITS